MFCVPFIPTQSASNTVNESRLGDVSIRAVRPNITGHLSMAE